SLVRPRQSHSLVPAARHECRRAQRRVKDGALAPPPGLSLMHASTTACSRGTGLDTSQLPPINYLGSRPFGSVILLTTRPQPSLPASTAAAAAAGDAQQRAVQTRGVTAGLARRKSNQAGRRWHPAEGSAPDAPSCAGTRVLPGAGASLRKRAARPG